MFSSASMCSVCELLLDEGHGLQTWEYKCFQYAVQYDCGSGRTRVGGRVLEGQFLHEQVDPGVHLKAVKVVGVSLQPHEEAAVRHIGRAGRRRASMQHD